jgi:membrane protein
MAEPKAGVLGMLRQSVTDFLEDDCATMAAALSYYTVFSLPPLLLLILLIAGALLDPEDVRGQLEGQLEALMGPTAGEEVRSMLANAERPGGGLLPSILGAGLLIFGATGVFGQLQAALNRAWEVAPDPAQGGIRAFITKRVLSFGMILAVAFLLMVSLALTAMISVFGDAFGRMLPGILSEPVLHVLNLVVSFAVIFLLFAAIFKVLPDARIAWKDVWVGALVTALLFVLGKFLIGFYLGRSDPGEAFGAAGSLAVLLVWIYYSSMILLFGAEFTQRWAEQRGAGIEPEPGAVKLVEGKPGSR